MKAQLLLRSWVTTLLKRKLTPKPREAITLTTIMHNIIRMQADSMGTRMRIRV